MDPRPPKKYTVLYFNLLPTSSFSNQHTPETEDLPRRGEDLRIEQEEKTAGSRDGDGAMGVGGFVVREEVK